VILVFDLDDTLYPERSFVQSGFRAVARYLERQHGVPAGRSLARMEAHLSVSRDGILDGTLRDLGLHSARRVRRCVSVYRLHTPHIRLSDAAERCLERFAALPRYVVTDGHKLVQRRKLQALGLDRRLTRCFVTHEHGLDCAKPSPTCFERIREIEHASPGEILYVGDDPHKDFVGLKPLGYRTLRVRQGRFRELRLDAAHEADAEIPDLDALTPARLRSLCGPTRPLRRGAEAARSATA